MTNELETCPICEGGKLHPRRDIIMRQFHEDENIPIELEFSVCDGCEAEICNDEQVNRNAQRVRDARNGKF